MGRHGTIKYKDINYSGGSGESKTEIAELTKAEYEQITPQQDIAYFVYDDNNDTEELDVNEWVNWCEPAMSISVIDGKLTYVWEGGVAIGANSGYSIAIPSSAKSIRYTLSTGSCYDNTTLRFQLGIGVKLDWSTSGWGTPADSNWSALNIHTDQNAIIEGELDLGNVFTDSYLYICGHGWNMVVESIEILLSSGSHKILLNNREYSNDTGGGGGGLQYWTETETNFYRDVYAPSADENYFKTRDYEVGTYQRGNGWSNPRVIRIDNTSEKIVIGRGGSQRHYTLIVASITPITNFQWGMGTTGMDRPYDVQTWNDADTYPLTYNTGTCVYDNNTWYILTVDCPYWESSTGSACDGVSDVPIAYDATPNAAGVALLQTAHASIIIERRMHIGEVSITPTMATGTKVADYEIDGVSGAIYAPDSTPTHEYSTSLKTVGTWLNGEPVYEFTYFGEGDPLPTSITLITDLQMPTGKTVANIIFISADIMYKDSTADNYWYPMTFYGTSSSYMTYSLIANNVDAYGQTYRIRMAVTKPSSKSVRKLCATVRYVFV